MNRYVKIILCVTAIIIISILFCLIYKPEEEIISSSTEAVMNDWEPPQIITWEESNLTSPTPSEEKQEWIITEYKAQESEEFLWYTLMKYLNNEKIVAGIMGYFLREGQLRSDAIAGWAYRDAYSDYDTSIEFTRIIDEGLEDGSTKQYFIEQMTYVIGGYGLGQWFSMAYLEGLYEFAQNWGTSIGDAEMQCAFMAWSIQNHTPKLWQEIKDCDDVISIGRKIGYGYDGSVNGAEVIASMANEYYKKYGTSN